MSNGSWNFTNQKDRNLFSRVLGERINKYGLDIEYWRVERDNNKDTLYSEDTKSKIVNKYNLKVHGKTIEDSYILTKFGIESPDEYEVYIDKDTFEENVGDGLEPLEGDYIYVKYADLLYQIADVDDDDFVFLQTVFGYKIMLKPADISGEEVEPLIGIEDIESLPPDIDDTAFIEVEDDNIVTTKIGDLDPFGDWN